MAVVNAHRSVCCTAPWGVTVDTGMHVTGAPFKPVVLCPVSESRLTQAALDCSVDAKTSSLLSTGFIGSSVVLPRVPGLF